VSYLPADPGGFFDRRMAAHHASSTAGFFSPRRVERSPERENADDC